MERKEIYFDRTQYGIIKRGLNVPLSMANKVAGMLREAGFRVNKDNITDCLLLYTQTIKKELVDNVQYMGEHPEQQNKMYVCETVFINNEHLQAEFDDMLSKSLKGVIMPVFRKEREETAREDFWTLQHRIYNVTHPTNGEIPGINYFVKWFEVKDGEVYLPDNLDELVRDEATIYADDEQTKEILKRHEEAVEALNKLMEVFAMDDLSLGFIMVGDKVARRPINYKLYMK